MLVFIMSFFPQSPGKASRNVGLAFLTKHSEPVGNNFQLEHSDLRRCPNHRFQLLHAPWPQGVRRSGCECVIEQHGLRLRRTSWVLGVISRVLRIKQYINSIP